MEEWNEEPHGPDAGNVPALNLEDSRVEFGAKFSAARSGAKAQWRDRSNDDLKHREGNTDPHCRHAREVKPKRAKVGHDSSSLFVDARGQ
jgi:hypothetical protein